MQAQLTDSLTLQLTLLRAVSMVPRECAIPPLRTLTHVTLHVVGADFWELCGSMAKFEELLHWLPRCKRLDVVLIGANLMTPDKAASLEPASNAELCSSCFEAGCRLTVRTCR
jgi:hypothetical protein